jgi:hypothetical protein
VDPRHELAEGGVDHAVLIDQASPRERLGHDLHLEVLAVPRGIRDHDARTRECCLQAPLDLPWIHHAAWLHVLDASSKEHAARPNGHGRCKHP